MFKTIFYTHQIVVTLFLLIYFIKTILLLSNSNERLAKFSKTFRVPEMIISVLFLLTGGYMLFQIPEINKFMIIKLVAVFVSIPLAIVGFKKSSKLLASLALLLIVAAYGLAEMSKKKGSTSSTENTMPSVSGKEIYSAYCVRCHGEDGKMGAMGAADLSVSKLNEDITSQIIKAGKGAMPGFDGQISDEQAAAVSEYIETLRK